MKITLALITGASSGIGEALCELLAQQGINLVISGRNKAKLEALKKRIDSKVSVELVEADLSKDESRNKLMEIIKQKAPNLVVNNAGLGLYLDATDYPVERQSEILKVDGLALLELSLTAAKVLKERKEEGIILNISSVAAFFTFPYFSVYSATKAFVNQFSKSMDYELQPYGIRVLTACPGVVDTSFRERSGGKKIAEVKGPMTAKFAALELWQQIKKQKQLHIFDWRYRLAVSLMRWIPESLYVKLMMKGIKKRST